MMLGRGGADLMIWRRHGPAIALRFVEENLAHGPDPETTPTAATEKQLLLSRLLARLAHEIRNPLSSLDIHVQLLEEDLSELPAETRERLAGRFEIMHGELHRLENLVKHFLRLSRPSELELQLMDARDVLEHVWNLMRPEAESRGIELTMVVSAGLPVVLADRAQLTQALLNLVINSLQAVEREGRVALGAARGETRDCLALSVADSGPGVSSEKQSAIFEPYFTTKSEGSGLGLWIAQQIVTAHGGDIQLTHAPSGGAVFTIRLPLTQDSPRG